MENINNNYTELKGEIVSEFTYSHQVMGEAFYTFMLSSRRLSDALDILPVTVSERLLTDNNISAGSYVAITGQFRSYNSYYEGKTHLILTVFARSITITDKTPKDVNKISLTGYICKDPIYRKTPFEREISDILLAVNRQYKKSDYIPVICWGRNARFASTLNVGDCIHIEGRIQSRTYHKKLSETDIIERTAYEVSASAIEIITNDVDK